MAGFPDRRAGRGIDQPEAQPDSPDVVAFLPHVFPRIDPDHEEGIHVQRFPELDGGLLVGLTRHFQTGEIKHQRIERLFRGLEDIRHVLGRDDPFNIASDG